MTLSVYLASRFSRLPELNRYRAELEDAGIAVTSRWLLGGHEWVGTPEEAIPRDHLARFATEDLEDIDAADVLVAFVDQPSTRGGLWTELGYAIGRGKPVIVIGQSPNIFTALPTLIHVESWASALHLLWNADATVSAPLAEAV